MDGPLTIPPTHRCFKCAKTSDKVKLYKCARCEIALYCSTKCWLRDQPAHSLGCRAPTSSAAASLLADLKTLTNRDKFTWLVSALLHVWGDMGSTHIYCRITSKTGQPVIICYLTRRRGGRPRNCRAGYGCLVIDQCTTESNGSTEPGEASKSSRSAEPNESVGSRYGLRSIVEHHPVICQAAASEIIGLVPVTVLPESIIVLISKYDVCVYIEEGRAFIF
jgi:hypothetical protein